MKKLGVAALVAGSCLAVCAFGKVDKKIAAGVSILSFVLGYNVVKWGFEWFERFNRLIMKIFTIILREN